MKTQESIPRRSPSLPSIPVSPSGPAPPTEISKAKRNTINQRRCRARRQVYVQDLERRIRVYEAQGVQATTEVQAAARKVAEENRALREEVKALREQNEALQRSLAARPGGVPPKEDKGENRSPTDERRKIRRTDPTRKSRVFDGKKYSDGAPVVGYPAPPRQDHETHAKPTNTKTTDSTTTTFPTQLPRLAALGLPLDTLKVHDIAAADVRAQGERSWAPLVEEEDDTSAFIPSPLPSPPHSNFTTSDPDDLSSTAHNPYSPPFHGGPPLQPKPRLCQSANTANSTPCVEAAFIIAGMRGLPSNDITVETEILPELVRTGRDTASGDRGILVPSARVPKTYQLSTFLRAQSTMGDYSAF
ncbi:uncharacterized protein PV07_05468 [Cladophialophora immunda]|uniref:BZIP domain-containing protein n=1 Tax=Cladophialophora immunda TaxID=569365 RepID=A0A0D2AWL2_9EURO|nr:uncharacterized protein PV07_05468 [Cladophialophora immunda]KIW29672.1 hypothetical protein PV07_05468 [Cladophialophora immunda]